VYISENMVGHSWRVRPDPYFKTRHGGQELLEAAAAARAGGEAPEERELRQRPERPRPAAPAASARSGQPTKVRDTMETARRLYGVRLSAQKGRLVAARFASPGREALSLLAFSPKKGAQSSRVLESADSQRRAQRRLPISTS